MAAHTETEYDTAPGNDYPAHEGTYDQFLLLTVLGICHVTTTVIALAIGGTKGAWWTAAGIILLATMVAIYGIVSGSKVASYAVTGLALVALALA